MPIMMEVSVKISTVSGSNSKVPSKKRVPLEAGRRSLRLNNIPIPDNGILDCKPVKRCSVILRRIADKELEKVSSKKRIPLEFGKKSPKLSTISVSENRILGCQQARPCSVILQKVTEEQLRKYSTVSLQPELNKSEIKPEIKSSDKPTEIMDNMDSLDVCLQRSVSLVHRCNNSQWLATEAHLDVLMAMEMQATYLQIERRRNQSRWPLVSMSSMNPVVRLEKLPLLINNSANEKCNSGHDEIQQIGEKKVLTRSKNPASSGKRKSNRILARKSECIRHSEPADSSGIRKSKRATVCSRQSSSASIYTKRGRGNSLCDKKKNDTSKKILQGVRRSQRTSVCSKRSSSIINAKRDKCTSVYNGKNNYTPRKNFQDPNVRGNEENIPEAKRKKIERKSNDSDDEDFFGFEYPDKSRCSLSKLKYTLRRLHIHTSEKENENAPVVKNKIFEKLPLKAINRNETITKISCSSSIFNDINSQSLSGALGKKFEEDRFTNHRLKSESDISDLPVDKLEILKLFKRREEKKHIMERLIQDQGKQIKSKKSVVEKLLISSSMDYYSDEYYIMKGGKRIPIWCEESISKVIMISQEQIPADLITDYFQKPPLTLSSLFLNDN